MSTRDYLGWPSLTLQPGEATQDGSHAQPAWIPAVAAGSCQVSGKWSGCGLDSSQQNIREVFYLHTNSFPPWCRRWIASVFTLWNHLDNLSTAVCVSVSSMIYREMRESPSLTSNASTNIQKACAQTHSSKNKPFVMSQMAPIGTSPYLFFLKIYTGFFLGE